MRRRPWIPVVAGLGFLAAWTPTDDGPTLCPFALATGHACPGCGLTRALAYLVRGDLGQTVFYHPLAPLLALGLAVAAVWWWGYRYRRWRPIPLPLVNAALISTGVALVAVWVGRMMSGTLPPV
jgi:hypothetical protein